MGGLTRGPHTFDDDRFSETRFREDAADNALAQAVLRVLRLQTCYILGTPELAWKYALDATTWLSQLRPIAILADFHFYAGLTALRLGHSAGEHLAALETWAKSAPTNFQHKRDLIAAELARIEYRPADALALYHGAIEQAGRGGFIQDVALGHELCGLFHRTMGEHRLGNVQLGAALDAYAQWGATAKVEQLEREFPSALPGRWTRVATPAAAPVLDYLTLIRSSEALLEELDFERLLVKLVRVCGEAANAERTVLALDEGSLVQRAMVTAGGEASLDRRRITDASSVPTSVLEHVFRSREVIVLGDAARERPFADDPYIAQHRVRSVLAVPIVRGDTPLGVLYFENNLTSDAFSAERAAMFRLLSAQLAIALENSRLFEQRKRSEAALRLLSDTSAQLSETLDYAEVLSRISRIIVASFADWCVVDALDDGALHPVSAAHVHPERAALVEELHRRYPVDASSTMPQGEVLRSQKPLLISEVTDEIVLTGAHDESHVRLLRRLEPRSVMIVPLTARERTIGMVTFVLSNPAKRYDEADLVLAQEVVRRFGLALENARLYRDLHRAMSEREERDRSLRLIFRHVPGAVWAVDRSLQVMYVTGRLLDVVGIDPRALLGTSVYDFLSSEDPTEPGIAHHLAALRGQQQSFEYQFRNRWYTVLIDPLVDHEEQIVGCVGAAFDVTEQRETAERLAKSEHQLQEAQRVAHVGSFEWEIRPNILAWSDELQRIYGFDPGQFAGTFEAFLARLPAEQAAETRKLIFEAYAKRIPFTFDHRIVRTDGVVRVLHSRGDIMKDETGKPVRMVGTCWDVTEQHELFHKLQQAVSRWEATVDATADGILTVDLDGNVTALTQRFRTLWQLSGPLTEGVHHVQLLASELDRLEDKQGFLERITDIYAHSDQESFDVIRFHDGRVFESYSTPQRIGDEITGRVWSIRDITDRERLLRRALFLADATRLLASLDVEQALEGMAHLAVPYLGDGCAIDLFGDGAPRRLVAVSGIRAGRFLQKYIRLPWQAIRSSTRSAPSAISRCRCSCEATSSASSRSPPARSAATPPPTSRSSRNWRGAPPSASTMRARIAEPRKRSTRETSFYRSLRTRFAGRFTPSTWPSNRFASPRSPSPPCPDCWTRSSARTAGCPSLSTSSSI